MPRLLASMSIALCLALASPAGSAAAQAPIPLTVASQVTHGGFDSPAFSPDGRRLALLSLATGREQLAIMDRDGGALRILTRDPFDHEDPAWSPDGRWIAYVSLADGGETIHLVRPDGSGDVALTAPTQRVIHPSWSPDSRTLFYCTDDDLKPPAKNDSDIWALDISTRAARRVISGGVNTYPVLSRDGRRLAFRKMVDVTNSEVWSADADGGHARNLTNHPAFDGWPAWSPDGRAIAFASNRDGNHRIYVMDPDGGDVRLVADTPGRGTAPQWTPDGREIWFPVCQRAEGKPPCEIYRAILPRR